MLDAKTVTNGSLLHRDRARIAFDWRMTNDSATIKRESTMKTILKLIVGLMLVGCGSMGNHVRNQGVASTSRLPLRDRGDWIAVDTICACP